MDSPTLAHIHGLRVEKRKEKVIHLWDRGFASNPWLTKAFQRGLALFYIGQRTTNLWIITNSSKNQAN